MESLHAFFRLDFIRNFMKLFSSSVLAQGLSLVLAPVLSRLYTPEDFGLVALYLGILSILSVIATAKYEQAIMLPKKEGDAVNIFWLVLIITLGVAFITALAAIFFNRPIAILSGNPSIGPWLYFLPLSILFHGVFQSATFYANRTKRFGIIAQSTIVQYTFLNGARVLAGWVKASFNGLVAGQLVAQLVSTLFIIKKVFAPLSKLRREVSLEAIKSQARTYKGYPKYNMMLNLSNNISGSLPIFMFTWGFSAEIAGFYAFGYTFVFRPLSLFSQSALQVLSQKIIENFHKGREIYPALKKLVSRFFIMGIIPFLIIAVWAPSIFSFVFSEEYAPAGRYLQILCPWLFMVFLTAPLSFIPELFFRQKKAMVIDIIYLVLRFFALAAGIWQKEVMLAMILFSGVSTLVVGYNLFWYLQLARQHQNVLMNKSNKNDR